MMLPITDQDRNAYRIHMAEHVARTYGQHDRDAIFALNFWNREAHKDCDLCQLSIDLLEFHNSGVYDARKIADRVIHTVWKTGTQDAH